MATARGDKDAASREDELSIRLATPADLEDVVHTLVEAFSNDPVWSWAFPDPRSRAAQHAIIFRMSVAHSIAHNATWVTSGFGAVVTTYGPGINEMSEADTQRFPSVVADLVGDHADAVVKLFERFEHVRPMTTPHLYVSMLGVRDSARGHGIGMDLLAHVVRQADAQELPVYLESSNNVNDRRYEAAGFRMHGSIAGAPGQAAINTLWRDAGGNA